MKAKNILMILSSGGTSPSWDHVNQRGGHQLPQWHQLYGEHGVDVGMVVGGGVFHHTF